MSLTAQHTSDTPEHGSPPELVELAHLTMGGVDVDPASSWEWNRLVGATRVITELENGIKTPWFAGAPSPLELRTNRRRPTLEDLEPIARAAELEGRFDEATAILAQAHRRALRRVFLNPPGERSGRLVAAFWFALAEYFARGWATSAVWIGFNVEQLARLQRIGARSHPLLHVTLIPSYRHGYRPSPASLAVDDQPPHASFATLLTRSPREIGTFATLGRKLGHVVNGDRR